MSEVIVVTSGKGGVGKTTTTANIGTGLAKLGKKVVMIDTDTGLRNLDVVLGLENRIVYNLVDVVEGNCRLKQAMIADKRCPNLFLLPTAQTRDKSAVTPEQMIKVIDEIKNDPEGFDYIILDCPAGIEQGFQNAIAGADRALVVTTPEVSAIRDADRIVGVTIRAYAYIMQGIHLSIPRGVEIKQWIDTHIHSENGKNWNYKEIGVDFNYVILDDDSDMLLEQAEHLVKTDTLLGLSEDDVERAIKILNQGER